MNVGDTFVNLNSASYTHLWVAVAPMGPELAIVNLTTRRPPYMDDSCIVEAGAHPFVVHESVVNYQQGTAVLNTTLNWYAARGIVQRHEPAASELLLRIQQGALLSQFTPAKIQSAVRAHLGQ